MRINIQSVTKGKKHTCQLSLSDGTCLTVPEAMAKERGLTADTELEEAALDALREDGLRGLCWERTLRLIAYRPHASGALLQKLRQDYPPEICQEAVERAEALCLLDDGDYAQRAAERLFLQKCYGPYRALPELRRLGIPKALAEQAVRPYAEDFDGMVQRLAAYALRHYAEKLEDPEDRCQQNRVRCALSQRGFSRSVIEAALDLILETTEREDEQQCPFV